MWTIKILKAPETRLPVVERGKTRMLDVGVEYDVLDSTVGALLTARGVYVQTISGPQPYDAKPMDDGVARHKALMAALDEAAAEQAADRALNTPPIPEATQVALDEMAKAAAEQMAADGGGETGLAIDLGIPPSEPAPVLTEGTTPTPEPAPEPQPEPAPPADPKGGEANTSSPTPGGETVKETGSEPKGEAATPAPDEKKATPKGKAGTKHASDTTPAPKEEK